MHRTAFMVYHTRSGRTRFVDQIFVTRNQRRRGFAALMLSELTTGPIELVVRRNNADALASYIRLGFCGWKSPGGEYSIDEREELYMRTTSYRRTRDLIDASTRRSAELRPGMRLARFQSWSDVDDATRRWMVRSVQSTEGLTERDAMDVINPPRGDVTYVVVSVMK